MHLPVFLNPFLCGIAGGEGSGVIVIAQISGHTAAAKDEQNSQQSDLSAGEESLVSQLTGGRCFGAGIVGQLQPVGDWLNEGQENSEHHRLDGEHKQILDDFGNGEHIAGAAHHHFVIEHHQRGLQEHIHQQTDGKPAQDHSGGGHSGPVQEQGEEHAA